MIRKALPNDAKDIAALYNYYVENTTITFETNPVSVKEMQERILTISQTYPFLVYEASGEIAGYCYASPWKKRRAYRHTVESTIYIRHSAQSKGIGVALMRALMEELKGMSVHAIIACIALPNPQSAGFHEKLGFRQVSCFKEVGYKFDQWIDVGDWELLL
ncbi:MAG: GNAT family N-acetyltransferase [Bacteroidales bacterium]|jgi:phosphinothricin acetyltransferase|nr:GNAT family N-acetyltransferase [Bacteroidales bacterium]